MTLRQLLALLALGPMLLVLTGCRNNPLADYFPLEIGQTWHYMYNDEGDITLATIRVLERDRERFGVQQTLTGDYEIEFPFVADEYTYFTLSDTAILAENSESFVLLKLPLEEGRSWAMSDRDSAVVLGRTSVTVLAGEFDDCFEVGYYPDGEGYEHVLWFAPGVGIVKILAYGEELWELVSD